MCVKAPSLGSGLHPVHFYSEGGLDSVSREGGKQDFAIEEAELYFRKRDLFGCSVITHSLMGCAERQASLRAFFREPCNSV